MYSRLITSYLYPPAGIRVPTPLSSVGPSVYVLKPRTEYSPPTRNLSVSGTQSCLFFAVEARNSARVFAQFLLSGKICPASPLMLILDLFDSLKNLVAFTVGL